MGRKPTLWRNARLATCDANMRVIENGALITDGGIITYAGEESSAPQLDADCTTYNLGGAWVTPGLIDCHTHLVFAGNRAGEYGERLRGISYEELARRGGGILSTVRAVRSASEQELFDQSVARLESFLDEGVTTLEIKSGYGLTLADEAKMLRVARRLGASFAVTIKTTLLAAHAVPPEFAGRADDYVDAIVREWLPALHAEGLVDAVDVFCESIAFDTTQARRMFDAAKALGLPVKAHAEQLANIGASQLAARHGAASCDHLEYATAEDAAALARAGVVAVLLPVAFFSLSADRKPPVEALRNAGVNMAIGSDCNPGSAPGASLLLAASMATRLFGLTPAEALAGTTRNAACALRLGMERGQLTAGFAADFVVWDFESLDEFGYWAGFNRRRAVVRGGERARGVLSAR